MIHNFRGDFVVESLANDSTTITLAVDEEINKLIPTGTYKATIKCISQNKVDFEQLFNIAVL